TIRARVERCVLNPALPSPPRKPIVFGRSPSAAPSRLGSSIPRTRRRPLCRRRKCAEGTDEKNDVHGIGAYCGHDAAAGGHSASEKRTTEPVDDRVRGGGVHRLPRGDRSTRVLARSPDVAALRRQRKEGPSCRCPRLDSSRITNPSFV